MLHARPVDVIVLYSAEGELRPLRFQMDMEEHGLIRINIDRVLRITEIGYVGAESKIFQCQGSSEDYRGLLELKYTPRSQTWQLLGKL